ncbi:MAG: OmpA family protein [Spirochaetes bacterium]|nr:OmpA family protein [Spirochaetota bacterium]
MKKAIVMSILLSLALAACDSGQKKDEPVVATSAVGSEDAVVKQANSQLAKVPYDGFEYKSSSVPAQKYDKWATAAAPVIKSVIDNLPNGYVLMIKGHSDSTVAENPKGKLVTNQTLSEMRAKAVYDALRNKGITSPKLKYMGVGDSEPISGVPSTDGKNRRVTFEVVKGN